MGSAHAAALTAFGCLDECVAVPTVTPGLPCPGDPPGNPLRVLALGSGEFACRLVGGGAALA